MQGREILHELAHAPHVGINGHHMPTSTLFAVHVGNAVLFNIE